MLWHPRLWLALALAAISIRPAEAQTQPADPGVATWTRAIDIASPEGPQPSPQVDPAMDPAAVDRLLAAEIQLERMRADETRPVATPSVQVGGRIFLDTVFFDQDAIDRGVLGNADNAVEVRSLRVHALGVLTDTITYKCEVDLGTGTAVFKDVFFQWSELPWVGRFRVGHFKEPFHFEELMSPCHLTFLERDLGRHAFVQGHNLGAMLQDHSETQNATWAGGVFCNELPDDPPARVADQFAPALTGRVTYLPWYDEATDGRGLLHTGVGASYRDALHHEARFRARPDTHLGPYLVDTGLLAVNNYELLDLELAWVYGPLSMQSEAICTWCDGCGGSPDQQFDAFYVTLSYFLTGEHRPYRRSDAVFERVRPLENFFRVRAEDTLVYTGKGAWEIAYRYDWLDLRGPELPETAGVGWTHTLGLNWYLNPYTRLKLNYIHAGGSRRDSDLGRLDILTARAQIDF